MAHTQKRARRDEGEGLTPLIAGLTTFIAILFLTSFTSRSYCLKNKDCLAIVPSAIEIPTGVWGSIAGAFSGAVFTYGIFNLLEIQKSKREPRPELLPSFDYQDKDCLVIDSDPHPVFLPSTGSQQAARQFVGSASYLRVKITNIGPVVCENARAYLTSLSSYDPISKQYEKVSSFKEPMALLWAFEKKYDLYDDGKGLDLPSQASRYADILVSYERIFTPENPRKSSNDTSIDSHSGSNQTEGWFLKLKTVIQPTSHERMLEIPAGHNVDYKVEIIVYGDKATPRSISLFLRHTRGQSSILVRRDSGDSSVEADISLGLHNSLAEWDGSAVSRESVYQQL
jgi:hypothetical protein